MPGLETTPSWAVPSPASRGPGLHHTQQRGAADVCGAAQLTLRTASNSAHRTRSPPRTLACTGGVLGGSRGSESAPNGPLSRTLSAAASQQFADVSDCSAYPLTYWRSPVVFSTN